MRFKKLTSLLLSAACLIGSILPGMSTVSAYDGTTYKYGPLEYIHQRPEKKAYKFLNATIT